MAINQEAIITLNNLIEEANKNSHCGPSDAQHRSVNGAFLKRLGDSVMSEEIAQPETWRPIIMAYYECV
jgi:hypothetical protein